MPRKGGLIGPLHEAGLQKLTKNGQRLYLLSIPALWVHAKVQPVKTEYWVRVTLSQDQGSLIITGPSKEGLALITTLEGEPIL